jgi:periplasmic protein TonB
MESVLDGGGQLERAMKPDPIAAPVTGSLLLHIFVLIGIPLFLYFNGLLHHNWGAPGPGGAIQVSLDSAAIPLPSDQPKTDNVLPTNKPSPAPAPPQPKATQMVDETAIPIQGKD